MQGSELPTPPKARSVAGVDAELIAGIAFKLLDERMRRIRARFEEPETFKPHSVPRPR